MERVALSLANGLAEKSGVSVTLVGPFDQVPSLRERISPEVRYVPCNFERRPDTVLRNAAFLSRIVKEHEIDVVSAHGSLIPLLGLSVPVAWTEHGPRYGDQPVFQGLRRFHWGLVKAHLKRGNWKLVGCSRYVCDRLCEQFELKPEDAAVILNGVPNAERLRNLTPPRFEDTFRIGFLGRLEPEKYPTDIFELDRQMVERGIPCEWQVFGKGSMEDELREKANDNPRINIRGLANHPAEALAEVDALVFLSHGQMEGLPTVILESRLARRPVVAWDVTANPEAAGPADELVKPFDLNAFADALERVWKRGEPSPEVGQEISYEKMIDEYHCLLVGMRRERAEMLKMKELRQS